MAESKDQTYPIPNTESPSPDLEDFKRVMGSHYGQGLEQWLEECEMTVFSLLREDKDSIDKQVSELVESMAGPGRVLRGVLVVPYTHRSFRVLIAHVPE